MIIVNIFFKKYAVVKALSTGFILPFFLFYAKDFELKTSGHNKTDIVKLKVKKIFFWINPFYLILGKVRVHNFIMVNPEMKYLNRIPSYQKMKYMPKIGRAKILSGKIQNGFIDIEDRTSFPLYFVKIQEIELDNSNVDLGIPLRLIFDSEFAYCKIDSGEILSNCENGNGSMQIQGVTWGKLINLDSIPIGFLKNKIDMDFSFSHNQNFTEIEGTLGQINRDPLKEETIIEKKQLKYKFQVDWNDYQMPFDLGLKKMIYQLLGGLNYGGAISLTVNAISEGIAKFLKKI